LGSAIEGCEDNMMNNMYYLGFEGEPEIQFILKKDNEDYTLSIWEGYFDRIMDQLTPAETGWTGIAYYYHMVTGWYDEDMWVMKDIVESYNQFKSVSKKQLDEKSVCVLNEICKLLKEAILNNYEVIIQRD
jgi:hypothetical protein